MGLFTRNEIAIGKGLCIILIVMHNVTHIFPGLGENEFEFYLWNVVQFGHHLLIDPISSLFSFFGWLGVSFFVFATGYGLTAKYGAGPLRLWPWIRRHYLKLFFLLLPAYLILLFLQFWLFDSKPSINMLMEQLLVLNVFKPGAISPGIYWYIGMAFQLYVWFLILRRLSFRYLLIAFFAAMAINAFVPSPYMSYFRHNSIGWLPELLLGMILARRPVSLSGDKSRWILLIVSLLMIGACALSRYTFTFSGLFLCLAIVASKKWLRHIPGLLFIGRISAAIYVVHAVVRSIWFWFFSSIELAPWGVALIVLAASILISYPYTLYYNRLSASLNTNIFPGSFFGKKKNLT